MEENKTEGFPSLEKVQELLIKYRLSPSVRQLSQSFKKKSITDIYGIARKEMQHSKFIAWLLDPKESHNLGSFALERLLPLIIRRGIQQHNTDKGFYTIKNDLLVTPLNTSKVSVSTEEKVNNGRIDIFVKHLQIGAKNVNIVIENKVESKEHNCQTETYYQELCEQYSQDHNIFLFLTPKSSMVLDELGEPSCQCKAFIEISYQDILEEILENILKEETTSQTRIIIEDYIHSITTPSNNLINQNIMIMAMNKETQQMLTKFWEANEELIRAALQALAWDGKDENAKEVLAILDKRDRDYSEYELNGVGPIRKKNLAYKIADYIQKNSNKANEVYKELDMLCKREKIYFLQEKKHCDNKRADAINVNGIEYYINNQWTKENIEKLIAIVNKDTRLGIEITLR